MKYFELNCAADDAAEQRSFMSSAWQLLHAVGSRHGVPFRVSFPFWKDPVADEAGRILRPGTFGPILRVFVEPEKAKEFAAEVAAHRLVSSGLVAASSVRDVPATSEHVAFVRSRANERTTDAYARKAEQLIEKRALAGQVNVPEFDRAKCFQRRAVVKSNFMAFRSKGNGHPFSLSVERIVSGYKPKEVNSYGLGGLVPVF